MKKINEILQQKQDGIDCTEEQSAELKMFVKNQLLKGGAEQKLHDTISSLFPNEYSEALDEIKNPKFKLPKKRYGTQGTRFDRNLIRLTLNK